MSLKNIVYRLFY